MATTTPNYGWDVPTSSDYVKLGAVAIETLGDDIDATLFSVTGGKNVGLQHLNTTTVSSAAAVNIDNVFTSAYQNYRIVFRPTAGGGVMNLQTRTAGSTNATSYFTALFGYDYAGGTAGVFQNNATTFTFLTAHTPERSSWICDVIDPKATVTTNFTSFGNRGDSFLFGSCMFLNAASVDGIRISQASGTFSGTIRIYGYKD